MDLGRMLARSVMHCSLVTEPADCLTVASCSTCESAPSPAEETSPGNTWRMWSVGNWSSEISWGVRPGSAFLPCFLTRSAVALCLWNTKDFTHQQLVHACSRFTGWLCSRERGHSGKAIAGEPE